MKQLRDPVGPLRADKQQLEHHGAVICDVRGSRHAVSLPAFLLREMTGGLSAEKVLTMRAPTFAVAPDRLVGPIAAVACRHFAPARHDRDPVATTVT